MCSATDDFELLQYLCDTDLCSCCSDGSLRLVTDAEECSTPTIERFNQNLATEVLVYALNCNELPEMKEVLTRICRPNVQIMYYCYAHSLVEDNRPINQQLFSSLPPVYGLDSFIDYWMKVHETTPDCVITLKTPVRLCHRTKKGGSAYIFGVELVGTMLAWIDTPYPLTFQSNHFQPLSQQHMCLMGRRAVTASIEKRGSVIMYVNERDQVIDRLDFYLEY
eukprot:gene8998-9743_t